MKVEQFIEELKEATGIPYIDVACCKKQEVIFRYFSGDKVTGKELLYMYSCGKVVTVIAALRLVEEGRLSLADKVFEYLQYIFDL